MRQNKNATFYEYIYDKLYEKYNQCEYINRVEAEKFIGRCYNIPKTLRTIILKEMEISGWIKLRSDSLELISKPIKPTEKLSKIGKQVGLW